MTDQDKVTICDNCATYDDGEGIIEFCSVHASARELLDVCKSLLDEHSDCKGCESSKLAFKAIAKAEAK